MEEVRVQFKIGDLIAICMHLTMDMTMAMDYLCTLQARKLLCQQRAMADNDAQIRLDFLHVGCMSSQSLDACTTG